MTQLIKKLFILKDIHNSLQSNEYEEKPYLSLDSPQENSYIME